MALMGDGEVMLGTNNRNFLGRFGSPRAKAYLVNPEVAAASAIAGGDREREVKGISF